MSATLPPSQRTPSQLPEQGSVPARQLERTVSPLEKVALNWSSLSASFAAASAAK